MSQEISAAHQAALRIDIIPHADLDQIGFSTGLIIMVKRSFDFLDQLLQAFPIIVVQDDAKFIAADSRQQSAVLQAVLKQSDCFLQNLIADAMPQLIIDRLEMIEIEEDQRKARFAPAGADPLLEKNLERAPVESAGQVVQVDVLFMNIQINSQDGYDT